MAILSGFVAAYALGRPGVANTLAGVAIAAALVPPLCVIGIGLTNDQPMVAANSAILLLPLMINVAEQKRQGQSKPLTYPVAAHVHEAVVDYLESVPEVTLVTIGRVSVEPASSVSILLATPGTIPAGLKDELTRLVHDVRGGSPTVRIIVLQEVRE